MWMRYTTTVETSPGNINSTLYRYVDKTIILGFLKVRFSFFNPWFLKMSDLPHQKLAAPVSLFTLEKGAITQLFAATAEEAGNYSGKVNFHRFPYHHN